MLLRLSLTVAVLALLWSPAVDADDRSLNRGGATYTQRAPDRSGISGGGHHALGGGGRHALGGGVHYHSGGHHHHDHHHGHHHHHGGGFYGGYGGFGSLFYGPGYFSWSTPGYSFYSGTTTVVPVAPWSPPVGGGYYFGAPGYYPDPWGPGVERPGVYDPVPADEQAVFDEWLNENRRAWEDPIEAFPIEQRPERFMQPSTPAAQIRSVRAEHEGDLQLRNLQYGVAARRYEEAIAAAPDRSEPYFRLAVAEAGRSNFNDAVRQVKLGLQLDAGWPLTATGLSELLGDDNLLARTLLKQRVADWTREDIRDPDRLFLLGVLLHMDGDDRSVTLFESAARLGGMAFHLAAFLRPDDLRQQAQAGSTEPDAAGTPVLPPPRPDAVPESQPLVPPLPEPPPPAPPAD